ncbi:hypothetical protein [Mesorhizobium sp.]|uniref:hypothetical protein n=1 Tax=Mesorhizobium sp. TaxID=1871066 RepID=UPI000FE78C46|nr:hypothetical protein [Mesorhizobium sp.]RWO51696.1 MAG: hypothetical protein EOS13_19555 [Mesorhizobium sp.]TIN22510.1 MAG: hypothetical protein E5Y19_32230 [Mesorhizobium sp.]TIN36683.1 MAG: hypothetical protein E5Y13_21940 [Mesorhizobium sp.]TJU79811.1 MAG: hypothetical protein E5Y15_23785 [Mesorhizobium sp.]TJU86528.1 MAG: hypothetical protein E5Y10_21335 [Mesorhizobium sp.]
MTFCDPLAMAIASGAEIAAIRPPSEARTLAIAVPRLRPAQTKNAHVTPCANSIRIRVVAG